MRALKQKARSQKGASITFALLLFLVCAIISSVVIVAATAAAGRVSQLAQTDQKYYAVNSAAELVQNMLEGHTMKVTATKQYQDWISDRSEAEPSITLFKDRETYVYIDGTEARVAFTPTAGISVLDGTDPLLVTAALQLAGQPSTAMVSSISLSAANVAAAAATVAPDALPALNVTVGNIILTGQTLTLSVYYNTASASPYALILTFKADVTVNNDDHVDYSDWTPNYDTDGNLIGSTEKRTITKKTITTVTWKLTGMQTVTATAAEGT